MTTASDLRAINSDIYNPSTNAGGLDGPGGMEANFPRALALVAQGLDDMAVYLSQANFVAAQASVATILQLCQALVAQITMSSTTALSFPGVDKLLLSTPNVVQTFVYDTRLDDRLPDGSRWNEPGRCAHLSYWHEALGTYSGVKRDVPAVVAITALREQWYFHDALDLDPVTGVPRLWRASNPTGNGLVVCGPTGPITSVFASNGYVYFGSGAGLHIVSLTGDWCDRYDNQGRRRRLGTFAQRNTLLSDGLVIASGALPATPIIDVYAHVYPGAPLDAAGMPVPTVLAVTATAAAIIHPSGQIVSLSDVTGFTSGRISADGRLELARGDGAILVGPVPYTNGTAASWAQVIHTATAAPAVLPHSAGSLRVAEGVEGGSAGLTFRVHDPATPAAGMVAHVTPTYASGWQYGDTRLATLCDAAVGSITGSELFPDGSFSGGSAAGWTGNGASASVVGGALRIATSAAFGRCTYAMTTEPGQSYLVQLDVLPSSAAPVYIQIGTASYGADLRAAQTIAAGTTGWVGQFTASGATAYLTIGANSSSPATVDVDNVSLPVAAADRSFRGLGLAVVGSLQRLPVASGADQVAWYGFGGASYLRQPYNPALDVGTGDLHIRFWADVAGGYFFDRDTLAGSSTPLRAFVNAGALVWQLAGVTLSGGTWENGIFHRVDLIRRGATGKAELCLDGELVATATITASLSLSNALLTLGRAVASSANAYGGRLALFDISGTAPPLPAIRRMYEDERTRFAEGVKCLLGGTSKVVTALSVCPLTGRRAAGTGDGVSVFSGLRRVSYFDETVLAATTSDTVRSVALRGSVLAIGTAAEVGFVGDAVGGKEAIAVGGVTRPSSSRPPEIYGVTIDGAAVVLPGSHVFVEEGQRRVVRALVKVTEYNNPAGEGATYDVRGAFRRAAGGNITLISSQQIGTPDETTSTMDLVWVVDTASQTARLQAIGVTGKRLVWEGTKEIL